MEVGEEEAPKLWTTRGEPRLSQNGYGPNTTYEIEDIWFHQLADYTFISSDSYGSVRAAQAQWTSSGPRVRDRALAQAGFDLPEERQV